jgi:hypothetical protein
MEATDAGNLNVEVPLDAGLVNSVFCLQRAQPRVLDPHIAGYRAGVLYKEIRKNS